MTVTNRQRLPPPNPIQSTANSSFLASVRKNDECTYPPPSPPPLSKLSTSPKGFPSLTVHVPFSSYRSTPDPCYKDCTFNPPSPPPPDRHTPSWRGDVQSAVFSIPTPSIPLDTHTHTHTHSNPPLSPPQIKTPKSNPPYFQNQRTGNNPPKMGRDGIQRPPHQRRFIHEHSTLRHRGIH